MLNLLDPQRVRLGSGFADYHLVADDSAHLEKGDSVSLSEVEFQDELPAPPPRERSRAAIVAKLWLSKLTILLPSFLQHKNAEEQGRRRDHPTAWLGKSANSKQGEMIDLLTVTDGLRGIAAFFVVWHHMSLLFFSWNVHKAWDGSEGDSLIQLPIIRLAVSGLPNVYVFFVISGYALSFKPLKLLRQAKLEATYSSLASSALRRHTRLFAPPAVICFISMLMTSMKLYGDGGGIPGAATPTLPMPHFDTIWAQFGDYILFILQLCDPFAIAQRRWAYNEPLWTLPVEFRSSFVVFGLLLALTGSSGRTRVITISAISAYCLFFVHLPEFLFCGGMLVAAIRIHFDHHDEDHVKDTINDNHSIVLDPLDVKPRITDRLRSWWACLSGCRPLRLLFSVLCLVTSLFLLSVPRIALGGASATGYTTLAGLIPIHYFLAGVPESFWLAQGAVALVLTVDRSPPVLQRLLLSNRVAAYLGRVSFSLYLVHGVLLQSLGWFVGKALVDTVDPESDAQYVAAVAVTALVFWPVTIWAADLTWRFVDTPSVRLSAWLQRRLCSGGP